MSLDSKSLLSLSLSFPSNFHCFLSHSSAPLAFLSPSAPSLPSSLPHSLLLPPHNTPDNHCQRTTKHSTSQVFIPHRGPWWKRKKRRKIGKEQVLQTLVWFCDSESCSLHQRCGLLQDMGGIPKLHFSTHNIGSK